MAGKKSMAKHPRIGAHVPIGKGLVAAAQTAVEWRVETLQMFLRNPRGAASRTWSPEELKYFRDTMKEYDIDPVVAHIPYIVNPASPKEDLYELARRIVSEDLQRCDLVGARYLVLHPGSRGGATMDEAINRLIELLNNCLSGYSGETVLLIETMAGMGQEIGATLDEIADMLAGVKAKEKIGVCLDTCHLTGAGFDFAQSGSAADVFEQIEDKFGFSRVKVIHANDSQREPGSHIDRHAPIGKGHIGIKGFEMLMRDETFNQLPFILETPPEGMVEDLETLRSIRDRK